MGEQWRHKWYRSAPRPSASYGVMQERPDSRLTRSGQLTANCFSLRRSAGRSSHVHVSVCQAHHIHSNRPSALHAEVLSRFAIYAEFAYRSRPWVMQHTQLLLPPMQLVWTWTQTARCGQQMTSAPAMRMACTGSAHGPACCASIRNTRRRIAGARSLRRPWAAHLQESRPESCTA